MSSKKSKKRHSFNGVEGAKVDQDAEPSLRHSGSFKGEETTQNTSNTSSSSSPKSKGKRKGKQEAASPLVSRKFSSPKRRDSFAFKAKKSVSSMAATSSLGKAVMKKLLDDETSKLMKSAKKVLASQVGKKAQKTLYGNIVKLFVKIHLQLEKKTITLDDFSTLNEPLRETFSVIVKMHKKKDQMGEEEFNELCQQGSSHLREVGRVGMEPILPYLSDKNIRKFEESMAQLSAPEWIEGAFKDSSCQKDLDEMAAVMNRLMFKL